MKQSIQIQTTNELVIDLIDNSVTFINQPSIAELLEAERILSKKYSKDISLDNLVDYPDNKFKMITKDLKFSVTEGLIGCVIRPNKGSFGYDLLISKTNLDIGDIKAYIGYPISKKSCGHDYEIIFKYDLKSENRYHIYPIMAYYVPDDEGYTVIHKEKVPDEILRDLKEREMDYYISDTYIPAFAEADKTFKDLFIKTVSRHNRLLK